MYVSIPSSRKALSFGPGISSISALAFLNFLNSFELSNLVFSIVSFHFVAVSAFFFFSPSILARFPFSDRTPVFKLFTLSDAFLTASTSFLIFSVSLNEIC